MENKDKSKVILPDSFASEEDAGEFWDNHSIVDFIEDLQETDDVIEIKNRNYEIKISEEIFRKLRQKAEISHESVPKVVD